MLVADQKRQNSCFYCLLRGDTHLSIATLREMLIYVFYFLGLISASVRLYYVYPVSRGNASQTWHCYWSTATEHLSISVTVQNAGQLLFVYILRGRECPHPPVGSDVISGKGRALQALSWPGHMRYVGGNPKVIIEQAKCSLNLPTSLRDYLLIHILTVLVPCFFLLKVCVWQTKTDINGTQKR